MFDIFGEFDSAEELNQAAAGLLAENDIKNILALAKENGIDKEIAQAFAEGVIPIITDTMSAAVGKLTVEKDNIHSKMPVSPVADYLNSLCMDDDNFAEIVRSKKKNLKACIEAVEKKCMEECKRTKQPYIADSTVFKWAKAYYTE